MSVRVQPADAGGASASTAIDGPADPEGQPDVATHDVPAKRDWMPRLEVIAAKPGPRDRIRRSVTQRLPLVTALATTLALLLMAAPAEAARRTVHDTEGDAPARLDITRFTVRNTSTRITAVIHVQNLRKTGVFQQRYYDSTFDTLLSYGVQVRRDRKGHLHVHAFRDDENGDNNISCRGMRGHWLIDRNLVTTSMPVRCATGVSFNPLHAYAASFDPGDLGVADSTGSFAVQRN